MSDLVVLWLIRTACGFAADDATRMTIESVKVAVDLRCRGEALCNSSDQRQMRSYDGGNLRSSVLRKAAAIPLRLRCVH